ncbi:hypothetical protein B0H16DRAFT_1465458 [Mycena metata]|uniref:Uncharacterized protein n=1 Tax=Mycena metata TaxID=1033252 RepID=A0AAD7N0S1_9AGAR|nr:hypothetical protein B0H16DRAFT_1465458 [Mycena metata]
MGYIVDLSLVMDQLFHVTIAHAARPLAVKDIDEALESYKEANLGAVHRDIRTYAGKDTIPQILVAGPPAEKVNELIRKCSTDLRAAHGIRASRGDPEVASWLPEHVMILAVKRRVVEGDAIGTPPSKDYQYYTIHPMLLQGLKEHARLQLPLNVALNGVELFLVSGLFDWAATD